MTDAEEVAGTGPGTSGGFADAFDPLPSETPTARDQLRALQAEQYRLNLRRIEVSVELDEFERRLREIAEDAPVRLQGPVEAIRFAQYIRRVGDLRRQQRFVDQRLRRLRLEIAVAIGLVARAVRGP